MNILILGCGHHQLHGIISLSENGHSVYGVDKNPNSIAKPYLTYFINLSVHDFKEIYSYIKKSDFKINLVVSLGVEASVSAANISKHLNLPYTSINSAVLSTEKYKRLKAFDDFNVRTPSHMILDINNIQKYKFPIILKQKTGAGSRGVRIINNSLDLSKIYSDLIIDYNEEIIVEEYISGSEHSVEGFIDNNGEINWLIISDRRYQDKWKYYPNVIDDGDDLPSKLSDVVIKNVFIESTKAVRAIGIEFGPVKGDIIVKDNIPYVIEMASRFSGDYFCTSVSELFLGKSILNSFVDTFTNGSQMMGYKNSFAKVSFFYYWINHTIKIKSLNFLNELEKKDYIGFIRLEPKYSELNNGDIIKPTESNQDKFISICIVGDSKLNIEDKRNKIFLFIEKQLIKIE